MFSQRPGLSRISGRHVVLLLLSAGISMSAHAVTACVSTSAQLEQALADASDSLDDDIRLQTGNYQLPATNVGNLRGEFTLVGGWNASCTLQSANNANRRSTGH
jgi:predicted lysophospholipase L1 biosynthesis ABC-type transport system permease subunit